MIQYNRPDVLRRVSHALNKNRKVEDCPESEAGQGEGIRVGKAELNSGSRRSEVGEWKPRLGNIHQQLTRFLLSE